MSGLDATFSNNSPKADLLNYTFELLLDLRVAISRYCLSTVDNKIKFSDIDEYEALLARLDVCIAYLMQLNKEARCIFIRRSINLHEQSLESNSLLFKQYLSTIAAATDSIWSTSNDRSNATTVPRNSDTSSSSGAKLSQLHTLKNKSSRRNGTSSSSKSLGSSIASTDTYSSKWYVYLVLCVYCADYSCATYSQYKAKESA